MSDTGVVDTKSCIMTKDGTGRFVCIPMPGYKFANGADRFVMEIKTCEVNMRVQQQIIGYWETDKTVKRGLISRKSWEAALEIPKAYLKPENPVL